MPGNTNYQKTVLTAQNTTSGGRYEVFFEQKTNTGTNEIYVIIDEISPEEGAITSVRHEINGENGTRTFCSGGNPDFENESLKVIAFFQKKLEDGAKPMVGFDSEKNLEDQFQEMLTLGDQNKPLTRK